MNFIENGNHSQVGFLKENSYKLSYKPWVVLPKIFRDKNNTK
jgi:hypothetical protein